MNIKGCIILIIFVLCQTALIAQSEAIYKTSHRKTEKVKKYISEGEIDEAINLSEKLLIKDSLNPILYLLKGIALEESGDISTAQKQYEKAIDIEPNYNDALFNLGAVHFNRSVEFIQEKKSQKDIVHELQLSQVYLEKILEKEKDKVAMQYLVKIYKMTNQPVQNIDSIANHYDALRHKQKDNEKTFDPKNISIGTETMPSFPGGEAKMYQFIGKNINYPESSRQLNHKGRVFVTFVVEKDGSISDVQILKGIDPDINAETKRVIRSMPKWNPGLDSDGKPVRVQYRMPIKFSL